MAGVRAGDSALVTGYDLGMNTAGGFSERVRVPADWVVPLPSGLSLRESMQLGTAGFTAGLAVERIAARGVRPGRGEVLVTGASGGVGSVAVALLARGGYAVVAATGKAGLAERWVLLLHRTQSSEWDRAREELAAIETVALFSVTRFPLRSLSPSWPSALRRFCTGGCAGDARIHPPSLPMFLL